jgi:hypothetical protein
MGGTAVAIAAIRYKTPAQLRADVDGFAARYVEDWESWLRMGSEGRPTLFGRILRKWQATRPRPMRRLREEAQHGAPFLDDLLKDAAEPLRVVASCNVLTIADRTAGQEEAFRMLWAIFARLPLSGGPSCVGITKAVLLLTEGRIGPALDARVRAKLGVARPATSAEWLRMLQEIGEDVAAFECAHGPMATIVSSRFAQLAHGRLYDMALGPR